MKTVTKFQAKDGAVFDSESQCRAHEEFCIAIEEATLPLGKYRFLDAEEYRQHTEEACLQAKRNLLAIVRKLYTVERLPVLVNPDDSIHPRSAVGRVLDDRGGPLYTAWSRLMNIAWDTFREFQQPYFTTHQGEVPNLVP
jgi:hypothetical protein